MKIRIVGDKDKDLTHFINRCVIRQMQLYLRSHIKPKKLSQFQGEFDITDFINTIMKRDFLVCTRFGSDYVIEINNNLFMNNSVAKLVDICNLINFGNLNCYAYPVFTQMFDYIREDFYMLYRFYFGGI